MPLCWLWAAWKEGRKGQIWILIVGETGERYNGARQNFIYIGFEFFPFCAP